MNKKEPPCIIIEGQKISWSMVQKIRRACGGDWDQVMDAFWKAKGAKGDNGIVKYIWRGLLKTGNGSVPDSLLPSKERNEGGMEMIRQWWEKSVYTPKAASEPMKMKNIFAMLAAGAR